MESLHITNVSQIDSINEVIHDEHFDIDDIQYDKEQSILKIPFRCIFHYHTPPRIIKRRILSKVGEVDVLQCLLQISNVQKYEIVDKSKIGTFSIAGLSYEKDSNTLKFSAHEDCQINIHVSCLSVGYTELEFRGKARITYGLFWESNTGKVYE